jgi:hypothetical protein
LGKRGPHRCIYAMPRGSGAANRLRLTAAEIIYRGERECRPDLQGIVVPHGSVWQYDHVLGVDITTSTPNQAEDSGLAARPFIYNYISLIASTLVMILLDPAVVVASLQESGSRAQ